MRRRLFALGRTDVYLHPATLLFAAYMVLAGQGALLLCSMLSILLHEGGHALMSACLGYPPEEVELTPMGCLMRLEEEWKLPRWKRLAVVVAGPAVTALLCVLSVLLASWGWMARGLGRLLFSCNAAILLMNALPALPLDGGRLLSLLLSLALPERTVNRVMRYTGTLLGAVLVMLNLIVCLRFGGWNLSLACAGCFLIYAAAMGTSAAALQEVQSYMARKQRLEARGYLHTCLVTVTDALPLHRAVHLLHPKQRTVFLIVALGTLRPLGRVEEEKMIEAYLDDPGAPCRSAIGEKADGR